MMADVLGFVIVVGIVIFAIFKMSRGNSKLAKILAPVAAGLAVLWEQVAAFIQGLM
jgi:hypothetical protein